MRVYVEAYDKYGLQVLGNLDGQGSYECKDYKRTKWYKGLRNRKTLNYRIMSYRIVYQVQGQLFMTVETVPNLTHPDWY